MIIITRTRKEFQQINRYQDCLHTSNGIEIPQHTPQSSPDSLTIGCRRSMMPCWIRDRNSRMIPNDLLTVYTFWTSSRFIYLFIEHPANHIRIDAIFFSVGYNRILLFFLNEEEKKSKKIINERNIIRPEPQLSFVQSKYSDGKKHSGFICFRFGCLCVLSTLLTPISPFVSVLSTFEWTSNIAR